MGSSNNLGFIPLAGIFTRPVCLRLLRKEKNMSYRLNTFCSYCGDAHQGNIAVYPKKCASCGNETYLNSPAVGIGLLSINGRLAIIRRAIAPCIGEWALPGGYKDRNETWEEGIAREISEEIGITVDPTTISLAGVRTADNGSVLVFGRCAVVLPEPIEFQLDAETMEAKLIDASVPLCFSHHQAMMEEFFQQP